jgi:sRNA-binding carbon storage regulator CsrA
MPKVKYVRIALNCPEDVLLYETIKEECKKRATDPTKTTKWLWYQWLDEKVSE